MSKKSVRTFTEIGAYHEDLRRLFARHQIAAMRHEYGESLALLERYEDALASHIAEEETWLIPLLRRVASAELPPVEALRAEHRKLRVLLSRIRRALEGVRDSPTMVKLISLVEREHRFKDLFETHSEREANVLFPTLDRIVPAAERGDVLAHLAERAPGHDHPV